MSIVTLTLEWKSLPPYPAQPNHPGWWIQIFGLNSNNVLFNYKFVEASTGPYLTQQHRVGTGPSGWILTPTQEPLLGRDNGATPFELPMGIVTEYLGVLRNMGLMVAGCQSLDSGNGNNHKTMIWTLQI